MVNVSLTNIAEDQWFENIPQGITVVLQARDQDSGEQYHSVQDIVDRFPLSQTLYQDTTKLQDLETPYYRYMVIVAK